jgi:hypothetical protein
MRESGDRIFDVGPTRVPIHQNSVARCAAEKLIQRRVQAFALISHRAVSTAEIADMVTGPRRQYAPL